MAMLLRVSDGDIIEYVPSGLGPHLKAWVRIDSSLQGVKSPVGPRARAILKVQELEEIWVRLMSPSVGGITTENGHFIVAQEADGTTAM